MLLQKKNMEWFIKNPFRVNRKGVQQTAYCFARFRKYPRLHMAISIAESQEPYIFPPSTSLINPITPFIKTC